MRIFLFALLFPTVLFSQSYTTLQTTNSEALSAYKKGISEVSVGEPAIAQGYFEKSIKADPRFIDAKLALAETFMDLRNPFKAEQYFEEALALDTVYAPLAFFLLGKLEWSMEKYAECAAHISSYLKSGSLTERNKKTAKKLLASALFAEKAVKNPVPFNPVALGPNVNTRSSEYFPSLTADGKTLIFTRQSIGDENFYSSTFENNNWSAATPLEGVNTPQNEGAQAISPDGTWLVFTACNREGDGSQGRCDLYWSQLKNNVWTKPVPFSATINSANWEAQPTIGADNKTIIFSRGAGGPNSPIALWQTVRQNNGKWSKPEKLPAHINVGGKVHTPFLHPDGQTLYFSADSLPGMGGSDIFFVRKEADGSWGLPQNIGYPINTKGEEGMIVVSLDGVNAFFASERNGGPGGMDIFTFELPDYARPKPVTYAKAHVVSAATSYPLVAKVDFIDLKTGESYVSAFTKKDGTALVCLPAGRDYALHVNKEKYLFHSEHFNLLETKTFEQPYILQIELQPIFADSSGSKPPVAAKPIILNNVFFDSGSASLQPQSSAELDRLALLLEQTPTLKIQINGHTDHVGLDSDNQLLSEQRAKAVHDYLIERKIDPARLRYKGFGETKPIADNNEAEGRARNRRTEFEVW